jgi:hypothetical protein
MFGSRELVFSAVALSCVGVWGCSDASQGAREVRGVPMGRGAATGLEDAAPRTADEGAVGVADALADAPDLLDVQDAETLPALDAEAEVDAEVVEPDVTESDANAATDGTPPTAPPTAPPTEPPTAPPTEPPPIFESGIDIFVDNFCNMQVRPVSIDVPRGQRVSLTWNNRSVDYPVDVWLSYGGGFLDLEPGTSWHDRFECCAGGNRPYDAGADISTACSEFRFLIHCFREGRPSETRHATI